MINTTPKKPVILIIDDSAVTLQSLTLVLSDAGYTIITATGGLAALNLLQSEHPDLILLDVDMPDLDGYETCMNIKNNAVLDDIPIIFLSGLEDTFDIVRGFNAGATDYIVKPVATEDLVVRVRTHLALQVRHAELSRLNASITLENRKMAENETRLQARVRELEMQLKGKKR